MASIKVVDSLATQIIDSSYPRIMVIFICYFLLLQIQDTIGDPEASHLLRDPEAFQLLLLKTLLKDLEETNTEI